MSEPQTGSSALRAVPDQGAETADSDALGGAGITPPRRRGTSRFVSDVLVELEFLPRERVDAAVEESKTAGRPPEQLLVESGAITADQLARAIAQRFGLAHVDLSEFKPAVAALNLTSPRAAGRLESAPIAFDD